MGIIKFNNVPSTTPGLEVETFPNYVAPEKEYQVTHVPGRNGDLVVDTKTYKNVPRSYKVSMAVEPPAVSVSGSTASFEATAERALAECKTAISSDVGKVGTTIINSATDPVENNEPYNFRAVPNGVGDRENDTLIGGTVAWNQISPASKKSATLTPTGSLTYVGTTITTPAESPKPIKDHIYYIGFDVVDYGGTRNLRAYCVTNVSNNYGRPTLDLTSTNRKFAWLLKSAADNSGAISIGFSTNGQGNLSPDEFITYDNAVVFDLTVMFGIAIADYVYSLELATAGAGVAWFRNLFPKDYYAYNAGELISVKTEAHKTTGKNLFDESTATKIGYGDNNYWINIPDSRLEFGSSNNATVMVACKPNITYTISLTDSAVFRVGYGIMKDLSDHLTQYDLYSARQNAGEGRKSITITTGANATYLFIQVSYATFDTMKNTIQIEVGDTATTYEPYEEHIYPLNPALELRGIPKLNSSNKLYYDGDIYSSDGSVIRKYGVIDLGSLTWGYNNTNFYSEVVNDKAYGHNIVCEKYPVYMVGSISDAPDKIIRGGNDNSRIFVKDSSYTDVTTFKTAMSGVYLIYELATPVIESTTGLIGNVSIASFDDGADNVPVNLLESEIVAVQDLHSYDHPWVGGAGKNKLPLVLSDIKSANTSGTWSGNVYTINSATFTVNTDSDGNVISIVGKGNGSSSKFISLPFTLKSGSYILTSDFTESLGNYDTFLLNGGTTIARGNSTNPGQSFTLNSNSSVEWRFRVLNNSNYTCKPMIRLSTETSATFEPYSNVCSISGLDSCVVTRCVKNLIKNTASTTTNNGITYTVNSDGTITVTGTATAEARLSFVFSLPKGSYIYSSDIDETPTTWDTFLWGNNQVIARGNDSTSPGQSFTLTDFTTTISLTVRVRSGKSPNMVVKPMVRFSTDTDDTFVPYNGNTYTFAFGQTVYGGKLNITTGLLEVNKIIKVGFTRGNIDSSGKLYSLGTPSDILTWGNTYTSPTGLLTNRFETAGLESARSLNSGQVAQYIKTLWISGYVGKEAELDAILPNLQIVYPIEPIIVQLSATEVKTLLGENNIFANTGNIKALSYPKQVCPFEPAQEVDDDGTEEYIDNREVAIPVGHESKYFTAGKIYNFSWLDEAGLIKEGELNADTGVLTITNGYGIVDLGDLTWTLSSSTAEYFSTPKSTISEGMIALSCSVYKVYTTDPSLDKSLFQTSNSIRIRDSSFFRSVSSSVVDPTFKSAMHGVKLLYELANPVRTIQLTPVQVESLIGRNVLISESGNISVTPRTYSTYTEKMNAISDWLHSASGYARLEDTYEPDYYRKAYYDEQTDMENIFDEAGRATLKFVCKPQRYLKSGEEPITISSGGLIQNRTRYEAYPILKVTTNNTQGSVAIGNHSITIKAGAGTDPITIDCELQDAWSGTSNKNSYIVLTDGEFPVIDPGAQTVTFDGGVQSVEVIPRWWTV